MGDDTDDDGSSTTPAVAALSHPVRRHVVEYLLDRAAHREAVGMTLLVNEVARFKAQTCDDAPESYQLDTVRTALEDHHLPRLEVAGLIAAHDAEDQVVVTESPATIRRYLATLDD